MSAIKPAINTLQHLRSGRMTPVKAHGEIAAMQAVLATLRGLAPPGPQQGDLMPAGEQ